MKLGQRIGWFVGGTAVGFTALSMSMASVPKVGRVTDDTAIYQNLSEIRVNREAEINFDRDIDRLSQLEKSYRENLPSKQQAVRPVAQRRVIKHKLARPAHSARKHRR